MNSSIQIYNSLHFGKWVVVHFVVVQIIGKYVINAVKCIAIHVAKDQIVKRGDQQMFALIVKKLMMDQRQLRKLHHMRNKFNKTI